MPPITRPAPSATATWSTCSGPVESPFAEHSTSSSGSPCTSRSHPVARHRPLEDGVAAARVGGDVAGGVARIERDVGLVVRSVQRQ